MSGEESHPAQHVRFGVFEVDLSSGELRKCGIRVKLQHQPFQVLCALLESPGGIVTREELERRIWGGTVTVDFEHGLRTAVNKLREALGDTADSPRYIETVPRQGYRFVAPLRGIPTMSSPAETVEGARVDPVSEPARPALLRVSGTQGVLGRSRRFWIVVAGSAFCILAALSVWLWWKEPVPPPIPQFTQVTWSNRIDTGSSVREWFPGVATDGSRIYFSEMRDGRAVLAYTSLTQGDAQELITPAEIIRPTVADISRDGTKLLVRSMILAEMEQPLWIVPTTGGSAARALGGLAHDATWLPDGRSILYAAGRELLIAKNDGRPPRKLATLPGRAYWIRYAPDGSSVRFTIIEPTTRATSLWELSADGKDLRPVLPGWSHPQSECCGSWMPDGRHFVFQSGRTGTRSIWALEERPRRLWSASSPHPIQITAGPLGCLAPTPARSGDRIFVIAFRDRAETSRVNIKSGRLERYLPEIGTAGRSELSWDGTRVAWISQIDRTLWQSRVNGSERLQLAPRPIQLSLMHWSPDDRRIAFMGKEPGTPWRIYIVPADGGVPEIPLKEERNQADPGWSPDGNSIVFGRLPDHTAEDSKPKAIHILNLQTRALSTVPGSDGLFSPHWSPDGLHIAAMPLDQRKLVLFDSAAQKWSELAVSCVDKPTAAKDGRCVDYISNPMWSKDGKYIYFEGWQDEFRPIYRVRVTDLQAERMLDSRNLRVGDWLSLVGLGPRDEPIVSIRTTNADIYAVDWARSR